MAKTTTPKPTTKPTPKPPVESPARAKAEIVDTVKSRCPKCQSTDREPYSGTLAIHAPGIDTDRKPYTHVVKRWTRCKKCGQARVDQSVENRME
jgi:hypothetical protein